MSLVFSAILPHPPIIIPKIGGSEIDKAAKTIKALKEIEGDFYVSQAEVVFIISPHSFITPQAFSLNLANSYQTNLRQFGYDKKELSFDCDLELLSKIKESADEKHLAVNIINQPIIDHGIAVPMYYLSQHSPKIKIVPISYSLLDFYAHYKFGKILRRIALKSNKRIAIIASGDLSHRLSPDSPDGYNSHGKTFDNLLVNLLKNKKIKEIMAINPKLIEDAGQCGLRSIIILLGAMNGSDYQFKLHSYESPYGVGYLVATLA